MLRTKQAGNGAIARRRTRTCGAGNQTGTGDVVQSFFLSPEATTTGREGWGRRPY